MRAHSLPALLIAILLTACSPATSPSPISTLTATALPILQVDPLPTPLPQGKHIIIQSASMSVTVADPAMALDTFQKAVEDAGGYVVSASSYASEGSLGYSSLSAKVPPGALAALRHTIRGLADKVQSESMYSQDATTDYRNLNKRLRDLVQAQQHVWQLLIQTKDPQVTTSLSISRELLREEAVNLESQLASFEDRAAFSSFDISIYQPAVTRPGGE